MTSALVTRDGERQIAARSPPLQSRAFEAKNLRWLIRASLGRGILPRGHLTWSCLASWRNRRRGSLLRIGSALVGMIASICRASSPANSLAQA
jgi:hypothetical protein